MTPKLPAYVEIESFWQAEAFLFRRDVVIPLQLSFDPLDIDLPGDATTIDEEAQAIAVRVGAVRRTVATVNGAIAEAQRAIAAVISAYACLPSRETREAMADVAVANARLDRSLLNEAIAAVERRQHAESQKGAAGAAVHAALPDARISQISSVVARCERAVRGSPAALSRAEEALFLRDPPPRLSAADEAAFAAAARDLTKR
jgi:hypothetical protein